MGHPVQVVSAVSRADLDQLSTSPSSLRALLKLSTRPSHCCVCRAKLDACECSCFASASSRFCKEEMGLTHLVLCYSNKFHITNLMSCLKSCLVKICLSHSHVQVVDQGRCQPRRRVRRLCPPRLLETGNPYQLTNYFDSDELLAPYLHH